MTGMDLPNDRGNVYVRASVLHDWKGDADYTYAWKGESRSLTEELGGTWYEYGLGANLNASTSALLCRRRGCRRRRSRHRLPREPRRTLELLISLLNPG